MSHGNASDDGIETKRTACGLGTWTVHEWLPAAGHPLHGKVERIWYFDGTLTHRYERLFPNGTLELVVQLDSPHRPANREDPYPPLALTGMQLAPLVIEAPPGRCRVLGIRLTAAGARTILAHPLREFIDATVGLEALTGRDAAELATRCHAAASAGEPGAGGNAVVRAAVRWSVARLKGRRSPTEHWLAWTLAHIEASAGNVSLAVLCARSGRSAAYFSGRFAREIGVTPKRYARLMRFRKTLAALYDRTGDLLEVRGSLAEIALAAGYYDQPHMHAEFREHAGMTPHEFLRAQKYEGSLSLPESHG